MTSQISSDANVGKYSARFIRRGQEYRSGFHTVSTAAAFLNAAERQGEIVPVGIIDSRTGELVVQASELLDAEGSYD